ncbi:MAG: TolC family protein [Gemmatimonadota bacterium]
MRFALSLAALSLSATVAAAQSTLSLDEAINLARRNNPLYLQIANQKRSAEGQVRRTYAQLLPSLSANMSGRYQETGQQLFQGVALTTSSDVVTSSYGIGLNYTINSAVLFAPGLARANRDAAEADLTGQQELLRSFVTQQYISVLQAEARAALQDTLMLTTKGQLDLAKARMSVGAGTILDVRRAEVVLGQAEVAALQQHNTAQVEMLRLFQQLGVTQPTDVKLTTRLTVTPVTFSLDSLKDLATGHNPGLNALRSREIAAKKGVSVQKGQYAPSLSFSTGWGGNTQALTNDGAVLSRTTSSFVGSRASCFFQDSLRSAVAGMARLPCAAMTLTAADSSAALAENNRFPFSFTKAPQSFSVFVSLPLFDNLGRETALQQAIIQRDDAKYAVKGRELALTADVTQMYLNLRTAIKTVEMQEVNAARAREELSFAEERYKVGAVTFLEVTTSRGNFEQAQIERLNAIYDYHKAFAQLESAVGRPLR